MSLPFNIKFCNEENSPSITMKNEKQFNNAEIFSVIAKFDENVPEKPFWFSFMTDNKNAFSVFAPLHRTDRFLYPTWRTSLKTYNTSVIGLPLIQFTDSFGNNICTVAVIDFVNPVTLSGGVDERSGNLQVKAEFFDELTKPEKNYETKLYYDTENIPYYEALNKFNDYRASIGYVNAYVPESALRRTYSTWYAFQRDIDDKRVFEQCLSAKQYGMNTVIVDDGWQTSETQIPYKTAGDWLPCPERFPDMKEFVNKLHNEGMKVVLWIATPFIGCESKDFKLFEGKLLGKKDGSDKVFVADPRFSEVRKWYVSLFCDRMKRWNLDGFKIDFINHFELTYESSKEYDKMDIPVLGEAVTALLCEISASLKQINPEVMLEYRQSYIGPCMLKSGNMFRVDDCAYGAFYNRVNGIDLRLCTKGSAVHSDMLMWDYNASPEAVADQLSSLLFIVPQISMKFEKLSESHKKVLKFYLDFIDEKREVLQHGKLIPLHPEANYSVVSAQKNGETVVALYSAASFEISDNTSKFTVVNASGNKNIFLKVPKHIIGKNYTILNCTGDTVLSSSVKNEVDYYTVPQNGMMFLC